jgi:hypothetical protein
MNPCEDCETEYPDDELEDCADCGLAICPECADDPHGHGPGVCAGEDEGDGEDDEDGKD